MIIEVEKPIKSTKNIIHYIILKTSIQRFHQ